MASLQRRSMDSHASHAYQHTQEVDEALQPDESHQETKHPEGPDPTQPPQPQQGTEASGASGGGLPPVAAAFVAAGPRLPGTGDATGAVGSVLFASCGNVSAAISRCGLDCRHDG